MDLSPYPHNLGDRFALEANCRQINALTVTQLATQYRASFEAAARRLVERNFRPCMLVAFKQDHSGDALDVNTVPAWIVGYCVASPTFKTTYFAKVSGTVPPEAAAALTQPGHDVADSYVCNIGITGRGADAATMFRAEFFCNTYSIFCLLTPAK